MQIFPMQVSVFRTSSPVVVPEVLQISIAQEKEVQKEGWILLSPSRQYILPYLPRCLHAPKRVTLRVQAKLPQHCHYLTMRHFCQQVSTTT